VSEVKKDEQIVSQENISIPEVEQVFEDFQLVLREEEKQPQQSESQPEVVKPVSQYEEQHDLLASMGFLDRNLNESLLIQFKNVNRVLDHLLA